MKFIRLISIVDAIGFSTDCNALSIMGDISCGDWVDHHSASSPDIQTVIQNNWVAGYLSGMAVGLNADILDNPSGKSLILWLNNYCRNNPLDNISTAASHLAIELKSRMLK
jgi:hypothetical protein